MDNPDFLLIGPPKTASSSLYGALGRHPQIAGTVPKEIRFFDHYYDLGLEWYQGFFRNKHGRLMFEASPSYFEEKCLQRIKETLGKIKVVCVFRNPTDRLLSNYVHFRAVNYITSDKQRKESFINEYFWAYDTFKNGWEGEERSLKQIIDEKDDFYFKAGEYSTILDLLYSLFGEENVKYLIFNDLVEDPQKECSAVFKFLGLDDFQTKLISSNESAFWKRYYDSSAELTEENIIEINNYYKPLNKSLFDKIDRKIIW